MSGFSPPGSSGGAPTVKKNDVAVGTRQGINLIEGANVTLTIADDSPNGEVDITIAANVVGASGVDISEEGGAATTVTSIDFIGSMTTAAAVGAAGTVTTAHGAQAGGTTHADVVAGGAAGFMTGAQATKLAGIATSATNGITTQDEGVAAGSNQTTINFVGAGVSAASVGAVTTVTIAGGGGSGDALTSDGLDQFAATTSAELAGVISDETGSGALVFANTPTLVTPVLGVATATSLNKVAVTAPATSATLTIADGATLTASATATVSGTNTGDQTNITGNAATVTTNANLTGPVTSTGNATAIANGAIALAKLANGTDGEIPTWDASGVITTVAVGTSGHVLTSNGAGAAPTFQAPTAGSGDIATDTIWAAKGDIAVATANDTASVLSLGTDGHVLTADSAQATGVKWAAAAGGGAVATDAIWDAAGDLAIGTGANTAAKLSIGVAGRTLRAGATTAAWQRGLMYDMNHFELWDDFTSAVNTGILNWSIVVSTGTVTTNSSTGLNKDHQGDLVMQTGASSTGRACAYLGGGGMTVGSSTDGHKSTTVLWLEQLSNGTDTFMAVCGLGTTASSSTQTNAIGFRYTHSESGGDWTGYCRSAGTETTLDTGIAATANAWVDLGWQLNAAGTSVEFFVNGVSGGTIATNIPTGNQMSPLIGIFKSLGSGSSFMRVDAFHYYARLARI